MQNLGTATEEQEADNPSIKCKMKRKGFEPSLECHKGGVDINFPRREFHNCNATIEKVQLYCNVRLLYYSFAIFFGVTFSTVHFEESRRRKDT